MHGIIINWFDTSVRTNFVSSCSIVDNFTCIASEEKMFGMITAKDYKLVLQCLMCLTQHWPVTLESMAAYGQMLNAYARLKLFLIASMTKPSHKSEILPYLCCRES